MLASKVVLFNKYLYCTFCVLSPVLHSEDIGMNEAGIHSHRVLRLLIDAGTEKLDNSGKCCKRGFRIVP